MELKAVSIDDLSETYGRPDLLFIDVEGYECGVLEGAKKTLASSPDCFIETHAGVGLERFHGSVEKLLGLFPQGYQFFISEDQGEFAPFDEASPVLKAGSS